MSIPAPTRLEQQLRRQRQMQQEQHNAYSARGPDRGKPLPPRQEQAQPDGTTSEAQQRHAANQ